MTQVNERQGRKTPTPSISVIVATRDRPSILNECLSRLFAQDYHPFEVIVVDNSTDSAGTQEAVRQFPALHVREDARKGNLARTRNQGIARSTGQLLAFIDDDTLVSRDWMQALAAGFLESDVGGVVGRVVETDAPEVETQDIGRFSPRGELTMNFNNLAGSMVEVDFLYGCNMAFRRSALLQAGTFDPWFGITYEEQDLSFRIRRAGYRLLYVPGMMATHLKAPRPTGVVQRSESFDLRSQFISCRSLAYLCVSHFGPRRDFARVAFVNLPKGAARSCFEAPSAKGFLRIPAILSGGAVGYLMAGARGLGLHRPEALPGDQPKGRES